VGDITLNGEADAEIAALLDDDGEMEASEAGSRKRKSRPSIKKRLLDTGVEGEVGSEFDSDDDRDRPGAAAGSRGGRIKEPGVGKGKWTRPIKSGPGEEDMGDLDPEAMGQEAAAQAEAIPTGPNTVDPRGVSEAEAKVRLGLVEDLEKVAWASICRDIPRVSPLPNLLLPRENGETEADGVDVPSLSSLRYCRQAECLKDSSGLYPKCIRPTV
jgi:DNA helicase INO80